MGQMAAPRRAGSLNLQSPVAFNDAPDDHVPADHDAASRKTGGGADEPRYHLGGVPFTTQSCHKECFEIESH